MARIEDVFRRQGPPTITYVEPSRYSEIRLALREIGRCVVIEGPSGIGKSTIIERALDDLDLRSNTISLSARVPEHIKIIDQKLKDHDFNTLIIDDFHRLDDTRKRRLADKMKIIADSPNQTTKLILVGINKAGDSLVNFAPDLAMRIDVFRLESNPSEKVSELVALGEKALNVSIGAKRT